MTTQPNHTSGKSVKLWVLLAAGSLTTMAGGVVAPVLPEVVQQLQLDPVLAGNLVSAHCLTIALFSPPLGVLADRIGPLRVLVPSLILYALFGTAGAFMQNLESLLVTRGLLGAASGGIAAASLGLVGSLYTGEARAQVLGYVTSTLAIAGIAFPVLGGWVGADHWQQTFYLYGLGVPIALLAGLILRGGESPSTPKNSGSKSKLSQVLRHPPVWRLLLTLSLVSVAMYAVVIYAPLYLKETIGAGPRLNGLVLATRAIGAATVSALGTKRLVKRLGLAPTAALGLGLMALTLVTIPLLDHLGWIVAAAVGFGIGFGIVLPSLYSTLANLAPGELRASLLAAGTGAGFLGQFLSPLLLGPVLGLSGLPGVFYAAAGVSIGAGLLLMSERFYSPP